MSDIQETLLRKGEGEYKAQKFPETRKITGKSYGAQYHTDEEGNEVEKAPAPAVKRGRGRPKKVVSSSPSYTVHPALSSFMKGTKTRKESVDMLKGVMLEAIQTAEFEEISEEQE